jgi:hypothetical protein
VACKECERLSREEIDLTRRAAHADARLQQFSPEPPFGDVVLNELRAIEQKVEETRAGLLRAKSERIAHMKAHSMTMSN